MQHSTWHELIKKELPEHYFGQINQFMDLVYQQELVYPPREKVFNAIQTTALENVKVVIIGQDLTMVRIKHKVYHFQYQKISQLRHLFKNYFRKNWQMIWAT